MNDDASLASRFCPKYQFSSDERYLPCSIERLVGGDHTSSIGLMYAPLYYICYRSGADHPRPETYITYVTVFPRDAGKCGGCVGAHDVDVEFVRLYLDDSETLVTKAFFSAHSYDRGRWLKPADITYDADSPYTSMRRPKVFVARGSHGNYPLPGCFPQLWCVGNDNADPHGKLWDPMLFSALKPLDPQIVLEKFGNDFTQFYAQTDQLVGAPSGALANLAYNLFYPLGKPFRKMCGSGSVFTHAV